jgi:hypothetical protein
MRLHRNVIEYANSLGLDCDTIEHARSLIFARAIGGAEDEGHGEIPLPERGKKVHRHQRQFGWLDLDRKEEDDQWARRHKRAPKRDKPSIFKAFYRRYRALRAMECKGERIASLLEIMPLDEAEHLSTEIGNSILQIEGERIRDHWPFSIGYGTSGRPRRITIGLAEMPYAEYNYGKVVFHVTRAALRSEWLPCKRTLPGAVILDAQWGIEDVWFMRWATMSKRTKSFQIVSGGYHNHQLVLGYTSVSNVIVRAKQIKKQARVLKVASILREAA